MSARKAQRREEKKYVEGYGLETIIFNPGAHGVNVTDLMRKMGIELRWEWPPDHDDYVNKTIPILFPWLVINRKIKIFIDD